MGEVEGGMFWENSIETSILWRVKQITSSGGMHEASPQGWRTLGRPRAKGWGGRREGGSGWGTHVNPWLIQVNVWQKSLQYCQVISLQLIKMHEKKKVFSKTIVQRAYMCVIFQWHHILQLVFNHQNWIKQYAKMRIKTQCPSYIHLATGEAPVVFRDRPG